MGHAEVLLTGAYEHGSGHAHEVFATAERRRLLHSTFGYSDFHGTFNFHTSVRDADILQQLTASREAMESAANVHWWFYICDLIKGDKSVPVVLLMWMRSGRKSAKTFLELMSRERIPDEFKTGELTLRVYGKWSEDEIKEWIPTQYWFQTFPWSPKKADSSYVWNQIQNRVEWHGKRVLDIGGHTGFFSFNAANEGAIVTLFEPDEEPLKRAQTIGRHIECADITYALRDPMDNYDTIMYLSVHHQPDPKYDQLKGKLVELKSRCKDLLLELIVPPLEGDMTAEQIDEIVGVAPLAEYKHKVRKIRRIYHVKGDLAPKTCARVELPTVACVYKTGGAFTSEYVHRLSENVMTHAHRDHRFVCLTDSKEHLPGEVIPLTEDLPGWWSKLELFKEYRGRVVYFDLDTILTDSIKPLLDYDGPMALLKDLWEPNNKLSTGVMAWNSPVQFLTPTDEEKAKIRANPRVMDEYHVVGKLEQAKWHIDVVQDIVKVASYKWECKDGVPEGTSVVCFHGKPRPHEIGWQL